MIFDRYLMPDYVFKDFTSLTPEWLKKRGVKGIVTDIDNTLVTYDDPEPTPPVLQWLKMLKENGIKVALVSNNSSPDRVRAFNRTLGFFAAYKSGKPFGSAPVRAMRHMGTDRSNTLMLGDQIFTDVMAGKCHGLTSVLVSPIRDKTNLFFRTKRWLEKPILRRYFRNEAKKSGGRAFSS